VPLRRCFWVSEVGVDPRSISILLTNVPLPLADLFIHAINDSAILETMIVISADPDLGYPISTLRLRGRRILLFCPPTVDPHFLQSTDGIVLDVLAKWMPPAVGYPQTPVDTLAIPSHFRSPPFASREELSDKSSEKATREATLALQQEKTPSSPTQVLPIGQGDEPMCGGSDILHTPPELANEDTSPPLVDSLSTTEDGAVNKAYSPYMLCVEAVEACSDSTGLIGAAFFLHEPVGFFALVLHV
jgi:hypothetical protein